MGSKIDFDFDGRSLHLSFPPTYLPTPLLALRNKEEIITFVQLSNFPKSMDPPGTFALLIPREKEQREKQEESCCNLPCFRL